MLKLWDKHCCNNVLTLLTLESNGLPSDCVFKPKLKTSVASKPILTEKVSGSLLPTCCFASKTQWVHVSFFNL